MWTNKQQPEHDNNKKKTERNNKRKTKTNRNKGLHKLKLISNKRQSGIEYHGNV